jgi:hypothetical protein
VDLEVDLRFFFILSVNEAVTENSVLFLLAFLRADLVVFFVLILVAPSVNSSLYVTVFLAVF